MTYSIRSTVEYLWRGNFAVASEDNYETKEELIEALAAKLAAKLDELDDDRTVLEIQIKEEED